MADNLSNNAQWEPGAPITAEKMNNIETAINQVNTKANSYSSLESRLAKVDGGSAISNTILNGNTNLAARVHAIDELTGTFSNGIQQAQEAAADGQRAWEAIDPLVEYNPLTGSYVNGKTLATRITTDEQNIQTVTDNFSNFYNDELVPARGRKIFFGASAAAGSLGEKLTDMDQQISKNRTDISSISEDFRTAAGTNHNTLQARLDDIDGIGSASTPTHRYRIVQLENEVKNAHRVGFTNDTLKARFEADESEITSLKSGKLNNDATGIANDLDHVDTNMALSAKQGNEIKKMFGSGISTAAGTTVAEKITNAITAANNYTDTKNTENNISEINSAHDTNVTNDTLKKRFERAETRLTALDNNTNGRMKVAEDDINALEASLGNGFGAGTGNTVAEKIEAAKTTAINTASADATNKANSAQQAAIDDTNAKLGYDPALTGTGNGTIKKKIEEAVSSVSSYSDTNLQTAKDYSDANLATAKAYSDANLVTAKGYTDSEITSNNTAKKVDEIVGAHRLNVANDTLKQRFEDVETTANNAAVASTVNESLNTLDGRLNAIDGGQALTGTVLKDRVTALEGKDTKIITQTFITYNESGIPTNIGETPNANQDYLLQKGNQYFYWRYIGGEWKQISGAGGGGTSSAAVVTELPTAANADANTDYFVGTQSGGYIHYRFIKDSNNTLQPTIIGNYANHDNIKTYNIRVGKENSNDGEVNYLYLYDFDYGESNEVDDDTNYDNLHLVNKVQLPAGGGSAIETNSYCSVAYRMPQDQILSSATTSKVELKFFYQAYEQADADTKVAQNCSYTLKRGNTIIYSDNDFKSASLTLTEQEKENTANMVFDVTKYCKENQTVSFTLTVTPNNGRPRTRPCSVELVKLHLDSNFNDMTIYNANTALNIPLAVSGTNVNKTIYAIIDKDTDHSHTITMPHLANAASSTSLTIPASYLTPGPHMVELYFTQPIGQDVEPSYSNKLKYDILCYDEAHDDEVLLSSVYRNQTETVDQYSTLRIPYYIHIPTGKSVIVTKTNTMINKTVTEIGVDGVGEYLFKATDVVNKQMTEYIITIGCLVDDAIIADPVMTVTVQVTPNEYSIEPVKDHLVFDFNPVGYINNPQNEEDKYWVDENNPDIRLSIPEGANFDWDNGGWQYDAENDASYFCIKAGSRAQINYSLFQDNMEGNTTGGGSEFKCIFKAVNVRNPEAVFLTSLDKENSIITEYSSNMDAGDQDVESEDTLFSNYFNVKTGKVFTMKKGSVDATKIAITVIDSTTLPNGANTNYIATDAKINSAISSAQSKVYKKNITDYINSIVGYVDAYEGEDKATLQALVNSTNLSTKNGATEVQTTLSESNTWATFRETATYDAIMVDLPTLIKNYALTYQTTTETIQNFVSQVVTDVSDDPYAKKEIKRVVATKENGDVVTTEIEIDYTIVDNAKVYGGISIIREILNEIERPKGLEMRAHRSNIYLNNGTLTYPYSEDDIIEFEYNICHPITGKYSAPILMYEDGVPSAAMLYSTGRNALRQSDKANIILGSDDCDIQIYRMKFYNKELDNTEILSNFYADALTPDKMVERYKSNTMSYVSSTDPNSITPQSVAKACPGLRIILIEAPNLTGGKNSFIKNTKIRCIYKGTEERPARPEDNWVALNAYHAGQGTSSDAYGAAGRNLDIIFGFDGKDQLIAPKAKNNYRFDKSYQSIVITGVEDDDDNILAFDEYFNQVWNNKNEGKSLSDPTYITREALLAEDDFTDGSLHIWQRGTGKVNLSDTSIPNNWFNIKLNIASSENTNNALLQKRYDRYLPYATPAMIRDDRIKNDMEFFNCVVFLKETGTPAEFTSDNGTDRSWHFYGIGNIGDSKKTDNSRVNIPNDPNEFCIEVSDNGLALSGFSSGVYYTDATQTNTTYNPVGAYSIKYPVTTSEWENENNITYQTLTDLETDGGWEQSLEFRYDVTTKDGNTIADSDAEKALATARQTANKQIFADMYSWVVTAPKTGENSFSNHLRDWFVENSPLYWYLFTERYTMIDSRAKNTFYHWGKVYVSAEEIDGETVEECTRVIATKAAWDAVKDGNDEVAKANAKTAYETAKFVRENKDSFTLEGDFQGSYPGAAQINNGYRFDLWDYDNDTALGINNNGQMVFDAGLEDIDRTANAWVYNEATNVFWKRIRNETYSKLVSVYNSKKADCFNAENLITEFDNWQNQFCENLWRMDFERKYYRPYLESNEITYLQDMANGRKKYQRREFERNMSVYIDSKYVQTEAYDPNDFIQFRPTTQQHAYQNKYVTIKLYSPMYVNFTIGNQSNSRTVHERGKAGDVLSFNLMEGITDLQNIQTKIFNASRIMEITGLENYYTDDLRFTTARKLRKLTLGEEWVRDKHGNIITDNYTATDEDHVTLNNGTRIAYNNNNTKTLSLGSGTPLLEQLDIRNCRALAAELNLQGCISLKVLHAEGTPISEVVFATNGLLKEVYLPSTIDTLKFENLSLLDKVVLAGYNNITSYTSLNVPKYDSQILATAILNKVTVLKISGINWTIGNINEIEPFANKQETLGDNMYLEGLVHVTGDWSTVERDYYGGIPGSKLPKIRWDTTNGNEVIRYNIIYKYPDEVYNGKEIYSTYVSPEYNGNAATITIPEPYSNRPTVPSLLSEVPSRPSTKEYSYVFGTTDTSRYYKSYSGWRLAGSEVVLTSATATINANDYNETHQVIVEAVFYTVNRTYPINWYLSDDENATPIYTAKDNNNNVITIPYEGSFEGHVPNVQDLIAAGARLYSTSTANGRITYKIFNGWQHPPINLTLDDDVDLDDNPAYRINANWYTVTRTLTEIRDDPNYSPEKLLLFSNDSSLRTNEAYFSTNKRFDITMGYDGADNGTLLTPYTINNTKYVDVFSGDEVYPRELNVSPLNSTNNAFTLVLDYQFDLNHVYNSNVTEAVLAGCYEKVGTDSIYGFRLYYDPKAMCVRVGFGDSLKNPDQQSRILSDPKTSQYRNIIVLRHKHNDPTLYIYSGIRYNTSAGLNTNSYTEIFTNLDADNVEQTLNWANIATDAHLIFGALSSGNLGTNQITSAFGKIYWAKYWNEDLGAAECRMLAAWPHETITFGVEDYAGMSQRVLKSIDGVILPNIVLTSLTTSSYIGPVYKTMSDIVWNTGDVMSWKNSWYRTFSNNRIFFGLPITLQSIISQTTHEFKQLVCNKNNNGATLTLSNDTTSATDYVFFPSYREIKPASGTNSVDTYDDEAERKYYWNLDSAITKYSYDSSGKFLTAGSQDNTQQYMNLRFPYKAVDIGSRIFTNYTGTGAVYDLIPNITRGDIFVDGETNIAFIYVDGDDLINGAPVMPNSGIFVCAEGGWVRAEYWWLRTVFTGPIGSFGHGAFIHALANGSLSAVTNAQIRTGLPNYNDTTSPLTQDSAPGACICYTFGV